MPIFWKRPSASPGASTDRDERASSGEDAPGEPDRNSFEEADRLIVAGHRLEDRGEFEAALAQYRQAVAAAPGYPRTHMNVGNALRRLARRDEAIAAQQEAIRCDARYAPARFNLGLLLLDDGDPVGAERELAQALRLQPDMFQAAVVLAELFETQGRLDEADGQFRRACEAVPDHAGTMLNYGAFCMRQGRFDEAVRLFERAKAADPAVKEVESSMLFALNFRTDLDSEAIAREHRRVGAMIGAAAGAPFESWENAPDPERRLRIGYVSGDFLNHSVAGFLWPVLEAHDHEAFEIFCFSNYAHPNPIADGLRELSDHWRDIAELTDTQTIERIRRDRIDVLVDLSGHTGRNRLPVFARHPAPVQATWLGYLNTTGLAAMDYRITDPFTDPPGETEHLHTEKLVRMPGSQWCYVPFSWPDAVPVPHPAQPEALVFGSFNQFRKISDPCLALWCRVLAEVPEATLLVLDVRQPAMRDRLLQRVERNGIDPARVSVRGREIIPEYFACIGNADVALDTFPYNGATTTLDILAMGVPLVALRGERAISRGSYSILRTLGADDLIAGDANEYVELNVRLARDRAWRRRLRETLRPRLAASPLTDAASFTEALERHYREMWRAWCARAPRPATSA